MFFINLHQMQKKWSVIFRIEFRVFCIYWCNMCCFPNIGYNSNRDFWKIIVDIGAILFTGSSSNLGLESSNSAALYFERQFHFTCYCYICHFMKFRFSWHITSFFKLIRWIIFCARKSWLELMVQFSFRTWSVISFPTCLMDEIHRWSAFLCLMQA